MSSFLAEAGGAYTQSMYIDILTQLSYVNRVYLQVQINFLQ